MISIITINNESISIINEGKEMICNFDFFLRFSEEAKGEVEVEVLDEEEVKVVVEEVEVVVEEVELEQEDMVEDEV